MPVLVANLLQAGLGILGNAVLAKGKDVVEAKLGVKLEDNPTKEQLEQYRQLEMQHEEFLVNAAIKQAEIALEAAKEEDEQVSTRWKADMASDSWMSKNIRPTVLIYIMVAFTVFAIGSSIGMIVQAAYIELLGSWGTLVMTAYFGGRTAEKIAEIVQRKHNK